MILNKIPKSSFRRLSSIAEEPVHKSSVWDIFSDTMKTKGPILLIGTIVTSTVAVVGYFSNRELVKVDTNISRIDTNISNVSQQIQQTNNRIDDTAKTTNVRIDDTAKTINMRIDDTAKTINMRIDDTAKTINNRIDSISQHMLEDNRIINAKIDSTAAIINNRIDNLGDKFDQLKDVLIQQKKSSWW